MLIHSNDSDFRAIAQRNIRRNVPMAVLANSSPGDSLPVGIKGDDGLSGRRRAGDVAPIAGLNDWGIGKVRCIDRGDGAAVACRINQHDVQGFACSQGRLKCKGEFAIGPHNAKDVRLAITVEIHAHRRTGLAVAADAAAVNGHCHRTCSCRRCGIRRNHLYDTAGIACWIDQDDAQALTIGQRWRQCNGEPALRIDLAGDIGTPVTIEIHRHDGARLTGSRQQPAIRADHQSVRRSRRLGIRYRHGCGYACAAI
nr:hypothetical protein [Stenotrophomonas mori]